MLDYQLTKHNAHCKKCGSHLTSLLLCPECGTRYTWSYVMGNEIERIAERDGVKLPDGSGDYIARACIEAQENLINEKM